MQVLTGGRKKRMTKCTLWLLSAYCYDPHFTFQSSGLLQTDCFKGRRRLAENVFRHYLPSSFFCHAIERSVKSRYHGNNISGSQKWGASATTTAMATRKAKKQSVHQQNNNFACASHFFVHFFKLAVTASVR